MWAVNRVASSVLGIVLLVGGLLAAIEAAVLAAGRSPWLVPLDRWHATLSSMALSDSRVLGASIVVGVIGYLIHEPMIMAIAAVWFSHIAVDRLIGYGLKFAGNPKDTHLSRIIIRRA